MFKGGYISGKLDLVNGKLDLVNGRQNSRQKSLVYLIY